MDKAQRKELKEQFIANKDNRRKRLKEYRKWTLESLFGDITFTKLTPEERRRHIVRACIVAAMALISIFLYWFCFVYSDTTRAASVMAFLMYLLPISIVTVMYGWYGGMACFTPTFVAAMLISPGNAYFLFYHLVTIYIISYISIRKSCRTILRTIVAGIISGLILSWLYYLIFVLVTAESFSQASASSLLTNITNIVPQAILICFFIYWFDYKCSDELKLKIGCVPLSSKTFVSMVSRSIRSGYRGLAGKIFALLLIEAIFMGVAAAFFANSLVPKMMEDYHANMMEDYHANMMEGIVVQEGAEENVTTSDSDDSAVEGTDSGSGAPMNGQMPAIGFKPLTEISDFSEAFETARNTGDYSKFQMNDQGISFDLKLIMLLMCVIHPIVFVANYVGQRLIVKPIIDMTDIMETFSDDVDQRVLVENKLAELDLHSEDEIQALHDVITKMATELNSYIDEIKREQQLKEDLRVAKAASEAKSNFLSNVSHEIRTPINAVLGFDEMILRESDDKDIRKYAIDIRNSGKTLLSLINDLLDFSKIEAGKMEIIPTEYELSSTINDLINMVAVKASDKGLDLKIDVSSDIPHKLYGDEIRIKQCVLNILNNAVKYTPEGSVTMSVSGERISDEEVSVRFRVVDTGIGIKEEDLVKLYSPFERIEESRNRTIEGTGLGMSIVKQLLDMMGSELEVSSVYGEGSDFSFKITQKVIDWEPIGDFNETYQKSLDSMEQYHVSFVAPDAEILVVDDTPMNLTVIKGLLKPTRVKVDTATSGSESLDKVKNKTYDIIFMDQRMPQMDGTETLHAMEAMSEDENKSHATPVICLTANVLPGAKEGFIKEGFADFLGKPVDAVKLEKMIADYLPGDKLLDPDKYAAENGEGLAGGDAAASEFLKTYSEIDGIDAKAALANCMNEEILKEAVGDFMVALKTGPDQIEQLWKEENLREYTIKVHALKSSARLIGALGLSELAANLEKAGDAEDKEIINKDTPKLLSDYRDYATKLSVLYNDKADEQTDDREVIPVDSLNEAYMALKEAVSAFDFDTADEIMGMLKDYRMPEGEQERYERLKDMVTALDRDGILKEGS
ncbi:MAG: response regulator [Lachnospiraceae bacterium]|nr:response regulator [Lachnospiraceae bacterium]